MMDLPPTEPGFVLNPIYLNYRGGADREIPIAGLRAVGLNEWTFDPTLAFSYAGEESGLNFALFTGVTFKTENSDPDYKSGSVLHAEASVQQILPRARPTPPSV